ncbi:hypothetical protein MMC15_004770 [Xylographa vitiligo]|nr:hypothetical protein [Xylographa vitiligo]
MYGVFQAYWSLRHKFNSQRLSFKLLCIKLVIFFTFWQTLVISIATAGAAKKPNKYIYQTDLQVVFNYLVLAIEMVIFAVMHLHAYSYKEYIVSPILSVNTYQGGAFGWRAFVDCFNYADLAYGIARYSYWMFVRRSHRHEEHSMRAKELGLHRDHEGLIPTTTPYTPLEAMQYPQKG